MHSTPLGMELFGVKEAMADLTGSLMLGENWPR